MSAAPESTPSAAKSGGEVADLGEQPAEPVAGSVVVGEAKIAGDDQAVKRDGGK